MITSRQNPKIKLIRKLNSGSKHRSQEGAFAAEGIRLLEEAWEASIHPEWVIHTENIGQRGLQLLDNYQSLHISCEPVTPEVMKAASDTETPQGILAIFSSFSAPLPVSPSLLVIVDNLRDPGNLGTLLRTSLAADADALLLSPGSVDPYSPKVLRSAMGAHFKLPVRALDWPGIAEASRGVSLLLADMKNGSSLWETNLKRPVGIILGSEAHGPGEQARKLADQTIHIPMSAKIESLNAAVAGAVLLFEVKRQRRNNK